jgi:hypothetical protein
MAPRNGTGFAHDGHGMAVSAQVKQLAAQRVKRRLIRAVPWLGGLVALLALGGAIRRKGLLGGTLHTALDMIPYVGGAKTLAEAARGRDFIRDRREIATARLIPSSPRSNPGTAC